MVKGTVFADQPGTLDALQTNLRWYPKDIWWYLLACQWRRIAQEEPFVNRTAEVGDNMGSEIIAAREVRDCLRMALLHTRAYAPYSKWLGTAFSLLRDPDGLGGCLKNALRAAKTVDREHHLGQAYQLLAARFNQLLPEDARLDTALRPFFDRPALILDAERFVSAALANVQDAETKALPLVGSIDQFIDSTDVLSSPGRCLQLQMVYSSS
ncbi:DUF4037 domain-containing protein [Arthrobacter sp. H5]|uniref:DUF4037 domain-containing protein n=1 Tax=Arthrobacter sp. H5 TaxID=1267973 RepID=UPI0004B1D125|nr:DUF4037 domain-containing protein [Arthrobacter sp. H5]